MAVPLPDDAVATVAEIVADVRAQALPAGGRDVRWVRLDGLHLTLRFLGPTPHERIAPTVRAVEQAAATAAGPMDLVLGGNGTFPDHGLPRAIWMGITEGAHALDSLAASVGGTLEAVGWARDDRPFRPHLTLARSDGLSMGPLVAARLAAVMGERRIQCRVDHLGLFESVTGGGPARYVPVVLANLGAASAKGHPVYHQTTRDPS